MPLGRNPNSEAAVIAARLARGHGTSIFRIARAAARSTQPACIMVRPLRAAVNDLLIAKFRIGNSANN
jgi:hypothetical protein